MLIKALCMGAGCAWRGEKEDGMHEAYMHAAETRHYVVVIIDGRSSPAVEDHVPV